MVLGLASGVLVKVTKRGVKSTWTLGCVCSPVARLWPREHAEATLLEGNHEAGRVIPITLAEAILNQPRLAGPHTGNLDPQDQPTADLRSMNSFSHDQPDQMNQTPQPRSPIHLYTIMSRCVCVVKLSFV